MQKVFLKKNDFLFSRGKGRKQEKEKKQKTYAKKSGKKLPIIIQAQFVAKIWKKHIFTKTKHMGETLIYFYFFTF